MAKKKEATKKLEEKEETEVDLIKIEEGLFPEEITAAQINGIEILIK